ncbi:tRNA dihydrouridine synthase DusB [Candidatus Woesearchaeota archaeon]|nr:tRNA dihydrouridine synthase DusB [Candidatus Woesearchaeota archaeon]
MNIGNIKLKNPLILAPMADVTTISFRLLCKEYGAGLVVTEMVNANGVVRNNKATLRLARTAEEERPVAIQIFGQRYVSEAAQMLEKHADIIDFNCGCPVETVLRQGGGAALLLRPNKLKTIIEEVTKEIKKPFTVKIRVCKNLERTARIIEEAGAAAIAVHGRTVVQGYSGKADWGKIKLVKDSVSIPVIGNGDVDSAQKCKEMLDETGCDAVMIGRQAMKNPYVFKQCCHFLKTGELLPEQTSEEKINDFMKLLSYYSKYNDATLDKIKRRAMDFSRGMNKGAKMRDMLSRANGLDELSKTMNSKSF